MILSSSPTPRKLQYGVQCTQGELSIRFIETDRPTDRQIDKWKERIRYISKYL